MWVCALAPRLAGGEGRGLEEQGVGMGCSVGIPCPLLWHQVLYLLGAMLLSMALQLDRHGLWNLLGPSLFALGIMAIAWVSLWVPCGSSALGQKPPPLHGPCLIPPSLFACSYPPCWPRSQPPWGL